MMAATAGLSTGDAIGLLTIVVTVGLALFTAISVLLLHILRSMDDRIDRSDQRAHEQFGALWGELRLLRGKVPLGDHPAAPPT